jgi:sugar O-acyltransferase (sialic acid O-acetyltransferase NeuD family)
MHNESCFVLWGSAGHAKVLSELIVLNGGKVVALFDNKKIPSALPGVPVHHGENGFRFWAESQHALHEFSGLAAIGGPHGSDRLKVQQLFASYGLCLPIVIHPQSVVSPNAILGAGTQVLALANVASGAHLGEACILNHRASVDHECLIGDGVHIAPGATICGSVNIGDNVFIGAGAVILPRLQIGSGATVGAGSVVTKSVPSNTVVAGNPARIINNL